MEWFNILLQISQGIDPHPMKINPSTLETKIIIMKMSIIIIEIYERDSISYLKDKLIRYINYISDAQNISVLIKDRMQSTIAETRKSNVYNF